MAECAEALKIIYAGAGDGEATMENGIDENDAGQAYPITDSGTTLEVTLEDSPFRDPLFLLTHHSY